MPKIIDFGIAKATDQRLTERTMFTEQGQFIGTPEYMSPEQTLGALDIDTTHRHLLARRDAVRAAGRRAAVRADDAAPRRATPRCSASSARTNRRSRARRSARSARPRSDVAGRRQTDAAHLRKQLAGDLDWITLKALEKDRARRYASASEFAADITRYLNDEPVLASPPSAAYRMQKFVRRHRLAVTAASLVFWRHRRARRQHPRLSSGGGGAGRRQTRGLRGQR